MKARIEVRRAAIADLEEVASLFDLYRGFFTKKPDMETSSEFIGERLTQGDSAVFVALCDGKGVGFLQLYPLFSSWYATRIWFLSDLYVDESRRKSGTGKLLVQCAQQFAQHGQARSIMVEIPHSEPHLVEFYKNLNFERDKTFDLYRYYLSE